MLHELPDQGQAFLSTLPAGPGGRRLALTVVAISSLVFIILAPFARTPLAPLPPFLPIYQSALIINDFITAVLLFGQFIILRSRALLMLATAYVFSGFMATAHLLSFPGLFAPTGLLGSGPQTTAWLYFFWHGGFPVLVMAYAILKGKPRTVQAGTAAAILGGIGFAFLLACAFVLFTTAGHDALPAIMRGNEDDSAKIVVACITWALSLIALGILWRQRPHSVVDLWLMIVLCVWIFDVALAAVLNHGRYDLGWYAGRIYGLLAATFVLMVLLLENSMLYARLVQANENEQRERRRAEQKSEELAAANKELESFSYSVSHDLRAPLRAINGYSQMLEEDYARALDQKAQRLLAVVRENCGRMTQLIDDLLAFSRLGRQPIARMDIDMNTLVREVISEFGRDATGVATAFEVADLPPAKGDRSMLKQVWINLISNAIKFSAKSSNPKVQVGVSRQDAECIYWVKDSGVGFDMKYYDKLFGVFQRLHTVEEFPGTGVGLAIVQRIVTRHDGRVWADSKLGAGATFYFTLQPA